MSELSTHVNQDSSQVHHLSERFSNQTKKRLIEVITKNSPFLLMAVNRVMPAVSCKTSISKLSYSVIGIDSIINAQKSRIFYFEKNNQMDNSSKQVLISFSEGQANTLQQSLIELMRTLNIFNKSDLEFYYENILQMQIGRGFELSDLNFVLKSDFTIIKPDNFDEHDTFFDKTQISSHFIIRHSSSPIPDLILQFKVISLSGNYETIFHVNFSIDEIISLCDTKKNQSNHNLVSALNRRVPNSSETIKV